MLTGGVASSQVLAVVFSPIVTRIYTPEALGILGSFGAVVGVGAPVAALCYPLAIILPQEDNEARLIARLSLLVSLIIGILLLSVITIQHESIANILGWSKGSSLLLLLVPVTIVLSVWCEAQQRWLQRKESFGIMARVEVIQSAVQQFAKVGMGFLYATGPMLVVLATCGAAFKGYLLHRPLRAHFIWTGKCPPMVHDIFSTGRIYRDFALYRSPQVFINAFSHNLPILFLAASFGPAPVGFYALGRMVLVMPMRLIGKSVGNVFYPKITQHIQSGKSPFPLLLKPTLLLLGIGAPFFGIIIIWGPELFGFAFGNEWSVGGEYARWLSPWIYLGLANAPCVAAIPALGLQRGLLVYEIISTCSKLLALYFGYKIFIGDIEVIALFSFVGSISYFVLIAWVLWACRKPARVSTVL